MSLQVRKGVSTITTVSAGLEVDDGTLAADADPVPAVATVRSVSATSAAESAVVSLGVEWGRRRSRLLAAGEVMLLG